MKKTIVHFFLFLACCLIADLASAQVGSGLWSYSNPKPFGFVSYQLSYSDDNNGIIVGEAGGIAKTIDGGGTWTYFSYTLKNSTGEIPKPVFNDLQFVNATTVYAVGNGGAMVKSED